MFGSGTTTLIVSKEETHDIMKIINSLEESGLLIKRVSKTIKNEEKNQDRRLLSMLLGILGADLLGNILTGKDTIQTGEGTSWSRKGLLVPSNLLTNFEIQKRYQHKIKLNSVYSRNNLSKIKDGTHNKS